MNRLLRFVDVMGALCVGKTKAYELRNTDPDFPKPVHLFEGGDPSWCADEVDAYIEVLKRRRDGRKSAA